ncbi:MAG: LuxR C-terminal-related transcriptional regulator [Kiritimatiellales bacterium]
MRLITLFTMGLFLFTAGCAPFQKEKAITIVNAAAVDAPLLERIRAYAEQELRVLAYLSEGKTNREIADALSLGEGTVRNYVSSVFSKLHVNNRAEAAAYAAAHNIRDYMG